MLISLSLMLNLYIQPRSLLWQLKVVCTPMVMMSTIVQFMLSQLQMTVILFHLMISLSTTFRITEMMVSLRHPSYNPSLSWRRFKTVCPDSSSTRSPPQYTTTWLCCWFGHLYRYWCTNTSFYNDLSIGRIGRRQWNLNCNRSTITVHGALKIVWRLGVILFSLASGYLPLNVMSVDLLNVLKLVLLSTVIKKNMALILLTRLHQSFAWKHTYCDLFCTYTSLVYDVEIMTVRSIMIAHPFFFKIDREAKHFRTIQAYH